MENKIVLTILHPSNLFGNKVGGVETFIKGLIKFCPSDIDIEYIGTINGQNTFKVGVWDTVVLGQKSFKYFPVILNNDENKKSRFPLSLCFTAALMKFNLIKFNSVLFFNRIFSHKNEVCLCSLNKYYP